MLGITRFDLLGDFGRYNWLGNFYVVFLYNMLFAGLTSASLIKTVTWAVQRELIRAFGQSTFILNYKAKWTTFVSIYFFFFSVSETELCLNSLHLDISFITFPTFGPISLWAGLSSSDRKNTILSGNCKGTGGESGLLGDLQAHRPRPLTAHTHTLRTSTQHKQPLGAWARQTHTCIHTIAFLTLQIASLRCGSSAALSHCLPAYFCSVVNRLSIHLNHSFS